MRAASLPRLAIAVLGLAACASILAAHTVLAQPAAGTVTGRVLWGNCIRAIPLPQSPDAQGANGAGVQAQPGAPDLAPPGPASRPGFPQVTGLPAGAVLVAVQNTSVSARTDEAGHFSLSGVPAGQYLTVAAGPVADSLAATAQRPNVFVNGGQSMDIGTLTLGGSPTIGGIACRFPVVPGTAVPGAAPDAPDEIPPTGP